VTEASRLYSLRSKSKLMTEDLEDIQIVVEK